MTYNTVQWDMKRFNITVWNAVPYATLWCDKISYVSSLTGKETKTGSNPASLGSSISGKTNNLSNFGLFDKDELLRPVA